MSHEVFTFDMDILNDQSYRLSFLHRISFVLKNHAENELLNFGKWKNFTFDQRPAIFWDIIEMAATIYLSKIAQMFATLRNWSIYIFRQRMNLQFETNSLLFWFTF